MTTRKSRAESLTGLIVSAERLVRAFSESFSDHLSRTTFSDVSFGQAMLVIAIAEGADRPRAMLDVLGQGTNVFYSTNILVTKGYARKKSSPQDKRASKFVLTPLGQELLAEIREILCKIGDRRRQDAGDADVISSLESATLDITTPNLAEGRTRGKNGA